MAVGGQGAPLVPYLDRILLERYFLKKERVGMLLNIGGISNLSVFIPASLDASEEGRLVGFDCGPGTYMQSIITCQYIISIVYYLKEILCICQQFHQSFVNNQSFCSSRTS